MTAKAVKRWGWVRYRHVTCNAAGPYQNVGLIFGRLGFGMFVPMSYERHADIRRYVYLPLPGQTLNGGWQFRVLWFVVAWSGKSLDGDPDWNP